MLRLIFVFGIVLFGAFWMLHGPYYGLLFYTWNAYFRPERWVWDGSMIEPLRLSLLAAGITLGYTLVTHRLVLTTRVLVMFAFLGWVALSTWLAPVQGATRSEFSQFAKCVLMTWMYVVLIRNPGQLRLFILVFALSLGFEGIKQGLVTFVIKPGASNTNTHPVLGDNNGVALGMLGLVPIFGALAATAKARWTKWFYWVCWFGVLYRGITTYSRGGLLACVAMLGIFWWRSKHKVRVLVLISIALGAVLPIMPDEWWERMSTITVEEDEMGESAAGRLHFWEVAVDMVEARPLLGFGYYGFPLNYDSFDFSYGQFGYHRAVHSSWFGVAAETGLVGFGLYSLCFFLAFRACRRVRRLARTDERFHDLEPFAVGLEVGLVVAVIASSFLTYHFNEYMWNLFGMTMAMDAIAKSIVRSPAETSSDEETEVDAAATDPRRVTATVG